MLWDSYPMTIVEEETYTIGRDSKRTIPVRIRSTSLSVAQPQRFFLMAVSVPILEAAGFINSWYDNVSSVFPML